MSKSLLGDKLRQLRSEHHLPLRKVAALLDIDVAILSKMERGERKLTKDIVLQLAELYHNDPEELLVLFLAEKVIYEIGEEELALQGMIAAEEQIKYLTQQAKKSKSYSSRQNLIEEFQDYFQSQHLVTKAWVFGSFARKEDTSLSDIDIAIEVPSDQIFTLFDLAEVQEQLQKIAQKKVDVVMLGGLRPEMKKRIEKEMILLYETR